MTQALRPNKIYRIILFSWILVQCRTDLSQDETKALLRQTCEFLWAQQTDEGSWRSQNHAILRGGESLTAFLLFTLLEVPADMYPTDPEKREKALDFIRKKVNMDGALGFGDTLLMDYPNYATAYALRTLSVFGAPKDSAVIRRMTNYLVNQQFSENRGFGPEDPAYGAWGFGETRLTPGQYGHVDLSHTRRALQALRVAGAPADVLEKSRVFLSRLQKKNQPGSDGGFCASTVSLGTNKADTFESFCNSYATATADGLLALLAAGCPVEHEDVQSARLWLLEQDELSFPEGLPEKDPNQWREGLFFYHLAARSEVYQALNHGGKWRQMMSDLLQERRNPDGSFRNPLGFLNKEDDPLIASGLAVVALCNILDPEKQD